VARPAHHPDDTGHGSWRRSSWRRNLNDHLESCPSRANRAYDTPLTSINTPIRFGRRERKGSGGATDRRTVACS
jgi:hypothetical protein